MVKQAEIIRAEDEEIVYAVNEENQDFDVDEKTHAEMATDELINRFNETEGSVASLSISKWNEQIQKETHCEKVPADRYDFDALLHYLRSKYGGGTYRLRVYGPNPKNRGRISLVANREISIEKTMEEKSKGMVTHNPALNGVDQNDPNAPILAMMNSMENMQRIMMENNQRPQFDFDKLIERLAVGVGIAGSLATVLAPILKRDPAPAPSDPFDQMKNMMLLMNEMRNFADGGNQQENGGNSVMAGLGSLIGAVMQSQNAAPAQPMQPGEIYNNETVDKLNNPGGDNPAHPYYMHVTYIIQAAQQGADVEEFADQIINALPNEQSMHDLAEFISSENLLQEMAGANAAIINHSEYVYALADSLIEKINAKIAEMYPGNDSQNEGQNNDPNGGDGVTIDN